MAAPKGNQFWRLAKAPVAGERKIKTPEALARKCVAYFNWMEENPLFEAKLVSFKGRSKVEKIPKMRAMTITGLCMFIGVSYRTWKQWKQNREDLLPVMEWAEGMIWQQKFEGAAADLLNSGLISRDLGLADRQDLSSKDGSMTPRTIYSLPDNGRGDLTEDERSD